MKKKQSAYSIGLDIGTSSVGFAVIKDDYSLVKARSQNYWGVHLFSEGETSEGRRTKRSSRRRMARKKQRIALLRMLLGDEILNVDPNFFHRLDVSAIHGSDKESVYGLFDESGFNDTDYFKRFPTVYHLRKYLMESNQKEDIRLVYLALAHILKHRGHFLFENQSFDVKAATSSLNDLIQDLIESVEEENFVDASSLVTIMTQAESLTYRNKALGVALSVEKGARNLLYDTLSFAIGSKVDISKLSPEQIPLTGDKFSLKEKAIEDVLVKAQEIGMDTSLLDTAYKVYSILVLKDILKDNESISHEMVALFDDHKKDLTALKVLLKQYDHEAFIKIFKASASGKKDKGIYHSYTKTGKIPQDLFYAEIKKVLKGLEKNNPELVETLAYIANKVENKTYLLKQRTKNNAVIPYQVHEFELQQILEKQGLHHPILQENATKIQQILRFRIPYYVGPLNPAHSSKFAWVTRKESGLVTPWNFEEKIDVEKSASDFIRRMTNTCTYILGEPVLPKQSLAYARYELYNELNNLRVEIGSEKKRLKSDAKQAIIDNLFLKKKTVSLKDIYELLLKNSMIAPGDKISGNADETKLTSSLATEIAFRSLYGDAFEANEQEIETLIEWITVYEDKAILERRINNEMKHLQPILPELLKLKCSGWGRLSRKLICETTVPYEGFEYSILQCLEITEMNFMEILNDKSKGLEKKIGALNFDEDIAKLKYDHVNAIPTSPKNKRAIYRSTQVVEEIVKYMGCEPESIFIEFARGDEKKVRTQSRKNQLLKLFEKQGETIKQINRYDDKDFDERLYLYFTQEGKCMYTGKQLEIREVHGKPSLSHYDVDHIIPRSIIKDDSLDNKALVISTVNKEKSDKLVLDREFVVSNSARWKNMEERGLISAKKYYNLSRLEFTDRDIERFVNRQLVETRQISKHVRDLLVKRFTKTSVLTVKAALVTEFRNNYEFIKIRGLNNVHHAHDAYLVAVLGRYVDERFPEMFAEYGNKYASRKWHTVVNSGLNEKAKHGLILNSMRKPLVKEGETINWNGLESIEMIRKRLFYKDYFVTKMLEKATGKFYNETLQKKPELKTGKKSNEKSFVPRSETLSETQKYGGYSSIKPSYGVIVRVSGKLKLIAIPVYIDQLSLSKPDAISDYLNTTLDNKAFELVKDCILWNQKFEYKGGQFRLSSDTEWANAHETLIGISDRSVLTSLRKIEMGHFDVSDVKKAYEYLSSKIATIFPVYQQSTIDKYKSFILDIDKMPKEKQQQFIGEIIKGMSAGKSVSDFNCDVSKVKFSAFGRMNNRSIDVENSRFYDESITGVYTKTYTIR